MSVNSVIHLNIYINLSIRDDNHNMDDSLCFRTLKQIKLGEKLNLIRLADDGVIYSDLSNQFAVLTCTVDQIVKNRNKYEQVGSSVQKRSFVTLETKIKVIHFMMKKKNASEVGQICKIDRKTAKNIFNNRDKWVNLEISGTPMGIRRALYAKFKPIDDEVLNFINFVRSERLPVTKSHIQACARQAATNLSLSEFKASNGWLQNFLRRSGVQYSFKLHGKGGTRLTSGTVVMFFIFT